MKVSDDYVKFVNSFDIRMIDEVSEEIPCEVVTILKLYREMYKNWFCISDSRYTSEIKKLIERDTECTGVMKLIKEREDWVDLVINVTKSVQITMGLDIAEDDTVYEFSFVGDTCLKFLSYALQDFIDELE